MIKHNQKFRRIVLFVNDSVILSFNDAIVWVDYLICIAKNGDNLPTITISEYHKCRFLIDNDCLKLFMGKIEPITIEKTLLLFDCISG